MNVIHNIKKYVSENNISFIVGAGFSTNISEAFPLWKGLLEDMVVELYPECDKKSVTARMRAINRVVAQRGYLGIASDFVKRRGFHEAIDTYIEEHMPFLRRNDRGDLVLVRNGEMLDPFPDLRCHELLLSLGIQHIYTFNYDNCLDILAGTDLVDESYEKERIAKDSLVRLQKGRVDFQNCVTAWISKMEFYGTDGTKDLNVCEGLKGEIEQQLLTFNRDWAGLNICLVAPVHLADLKDWAIRSYSLFDNAYFVLTGDIEAAKAMRLNKYSLVTHDYQISLTNIGKHIYKLHGNLRTKEEDEYGFDDDRHIQYVITGEDYERYPVKHEAFVNLMHIALLKGCFCMIGFSGDDPNFAVWMNWVKDVLDKNLSKRGQVRLENPIYYINVDEVDCLTKDKRLMLRNNYIDVVDLAEFYPHLSMRDRMLHFLQDIRSDGSYVDDFNKSSRQLTLMRLADLDKPDVGPAVEHLFSLLGHFRFPPMNYSTHFYRMRWIGFLQYGFKKRVSREQRERMAKLLYFSLRCELLPLGQIASRLPHDFMARLSPLLSEGFHELDLRDRALCHRAFPAEEGDAACYEHFLNLLFSLDFDGAYHGLADWNPSDGFNRMRRLLLLSVFDDLLKSEDFGSVFSSESYDNVQDFYLALTILPFVRGVWGEDDSKKMTLFKDVQVKIDELKRLIPEMEGWHEIKDFFLAEVREKEGVAAYGNCKNTISLSSYDVHYIGAIQLLQHMVEFGLATNLQHVQFLNPEDWAKICHGLFVSYPYPCLYLTLLYGNSKDLVKRVAQEYVFSNDLYDSLPDLLRCMLGALLQEHVPSEVKCAIYVAAPLFMRAVAPAEWRDLFIRYYNGRDTTFSGFEVRATSLVPFIETGLRLCGDSKFKNRVILKILSSPESVTDTENHMIIAATYHLEVLEDMVLSAVNHFVEVADREEQWYILLNMGGLLDQQLMIKFLKSCPDSLYKDESFVEGCCCYISSVEDDGIKERLCSAVRNSPSVWATGINRARASVTVPCERLDINYIQRFICLEHDALVAIYHKLEQAFEDISYMVKKENSSIAMQSFYHWETILFEMYIFLERNEHVLKSEVCFLMTKRKVLALLKKVSGGGDVYSVLLDDEHSGHAIYMLTELVNERTVVSFAQCYILLANRIISRSSCKLESCLVHFSWVLSKYRAHFNRDLFRPLVQCILDSYRPYFSSKSPLSWDVAWADKSVVERELLKLYDVYERWGGKDAFWKEYSPRYFF